MANLDSYVTKGKSDVQDRLQKATQDVEKMGRDFQETKNGLSGMPGGLDSDILSMINDAREQGKAEAEADIEGVKSSAVADAKSSADSIKTDVTQKINDNTTAKNKMSGISSKYGKAAIERASSALDQNTAKGNQLMSVLENALREADRTIAGVKDSL